MVLSCSTLLWFLTISKEAATYRLLLTNFGVWTGGFNKLTFSGLKTSAYELLSYCCTFSSLPSKFLSCSFHIFYKSLVVCFLSFYNLWDWCLWNLLWAFICAESSSLNLFPVYRKNFIDLIISRRFCNLFLSPVETLRSLMAFKRFFLSLSTISCLVMMAEDTCLVEIDGIVERLFIWESRSSHRFSIWMLIWSTLGELFVGNLASWVFF